MLMERCFGSMRAAISVLVVRNDLVGSIVRVGSTIALCVRSRLFGLKWCARTFACTFPLVWSRMSATSVVAKYCFVDLAEGFDRHTLFRDVARSRERFLRTQLRETGALDLRKVRMKTERLSRRC